MDGLKLTTYWREAEARAEARIVAPLSGLWLQGCGFNAATASITENAASDPGFAGLPTCYVAWIPAAQAVAGKLRLPLYATPTRERLVAYLHLPCADAGSRWLLYSAAFFLATA
jgi:hypothetical protein